MNVHIQGVRQILTQSPLRNFTYMIACQAEGGRETGWLCVDPYDGEAVWDWCQAQGGTLHAIANTHEHWDHTQGNAYLTDRASCPVYAHPAARSKIAEATHFLGHGEEISLSEGRTLKALHTPGHTCAGLTFVLQEGQKECQTPRAIFTGDTLFNAGVGNCHNGGNVEQLFQTIRGIYAQFPDSVVVYPGHEYLQNNLRFTLSIEPGNQRAKALLQTWDTIDWERQPWATRFGEEREINTFLRLMHPSVQSALAQNGDGPLEAKQVFLTLREKRDSW